MKIIKKIIFAISLIFIIFIITPIDKEKLYPSDFNSFEICDRNGILLRKILSHNYRTSIWKNLEEISPWMIKVTIEREDKRFFKHFGVDIIAIFRALLENIKSRKIVSGGSTITMQVAKMFFSLKNRNIFNKILEIIYAIKLEFHLSKKEILEIYLNRAPYGNRNYGVEAAARFYFQKSSSYLSLGESVILALIPKSPTKLNPLSNPEKITLEKKKFLKKLFKKGVIDSFSFICALKESLFLRIPDVVFEAPHFVDYILEKLDSINIKRPLKIITTIDINLQNKIEAMLKTTLNSLRNYKINQGAVLVMDNKTGDILAMVGSKDYFDEKEGQVNGCISLRQPGSAIKPFLYILAFENGFSPSDIIIDTLTEFKLPDGTKFAPKNYGGKFYGPVRLREALALSLNIPAVYLINKITPQRFYYFLKNIGFKNLDKPPNFYGLSLSLGAAEVTLLELVNAYRTIANGGFYSKPRFIIGVYDLDKGYIEFKNDNPKEVFKKETAYIITHILSDNVSRIKVFGDDSPLNLPFACASKTGTSKDYKDNWCVGFTNDYTVGVWVGNFDSKPMQGVSGISGAAPLYRDIMIELHRNNTPCIFEEPFKIVHKKICAKTGLIASKNCSRIIEEIFVEGTEPKEICNNCSLFTKNNFDLDSEILKIISPCDGDIFKIDPHITKINQKIKFKVLANDRIENVVFVLNGKRISENKRPFEFYWTPIEGEHELEVVGIGKGILEKRKIKFKVLK